MAMASESVKYLVDQFVTLEELLGMVDRRFPRIERLEIGRSPRSLHIGD